MQTELTIENETKTLEHKTRVHIDRHPYESPNPTTGVALYALGKVSAGFQLYREAKGDTEDEPIHNDGEKEPLTPDEHFYSKEGHHKGFDIIVDANPEHVNTKRVSYDEIVRLAFPTPPPGILMFVVTYYNGPKANPEGKLTAGHKVKIQNKMVFNVKATNRS